MTIARTVLPGILFVTALSAQVAPFRVVVPNSADGVEGASSTSIPFGSTLARRVLYAYDGSAVGYMTPVRIGGIELRCNGQAPGTSAIGTYTFTLVASTGKNAVGSLDPTFANNHGGDKTQVFGNTLNIAAPTTVQSPNPFSLRIPFAPEFEWDPRLGPLVLDFTYFASTPAFGSWDAVSGGVGGLSALGNTGVATSTLTNAPVLQLDLAGNVLPSTFANVEGQASTSIPWSLGTGAVERSQSLYEASVVGFTGRRRITALAWRTDSGVAFAGRTYDVRITLSTTTRTAANMSSSFASNIGADATVVFDGSLVAGPSPSSFDLAHFDLFCELQRPFVYDPALGSLCVDVQMRGATGPPAVSFDCTNAAGLAVARMFNSTSATAATANLGPQPGVVQVMAVRSVPLLTAPDSLTYAVNPNTSNVTSFPFNNAGCRSMQILSGTGLGQPFFVRALAFRPARTLTSFGPTTYTCTIDMSHTATTPAAISATFDNNHGLDRTRVFDGSFSVPFGTWSNSEVGFPIEVELQHPFVWSSILPNLCIDIVVTAQAGPGIQVETTLGLTVDDARVTNVNALAATGSVQQLAATVQLSGFGRNGTALNYGAGCGGSNGAPIATTIGLPFLPNPDFAARVHRAAGNTAAFYVVGFAPLSVALPSTNNCLLLSAGEIGILGAAITDVLGDGVVPLPLFGSPVDDGFQFRGQWLILDPNANALGLTTSDAQLLTARFF